MKYFKWRDKHIERVQELSQQEQTAKEIADTMFKEIGVKNGFVGANKLMYALVYDDDRLKVEHFI